MPCRVYPETSQMKFDSMELAILVEKAHKRIVEQLTSYQNIPERLAILVSPCKKSDSTGQRVPPEHTKFNCSFVLCKQHLLTAASPVVMFVNIVFVFKDAMPTLNVL